MSTPAPVQAPYVCTERTVQADWIDYNGHLNMAYYNVLFDKAVDDAYDAIGIGESYVQSSGGSCFTLEVHVNYLQELVHNDPVRVTFQLLDWDHKRLHFFEHMYHATEGYLAATSEQLALHVDMNTRKSAAFPAAAQRVLTAWHAAHAELPQPEYAGRRIGIKRKG